jgi:hypothetical protein
MNYVSLPILVQGNVKLRNRQAMRYTPIENILPSDQIEMPLNIAIRPIADMHTRNPTELPSCFKCLTISKFHAD